MHARSLALGLEGMLEGDRLTIAEILYYMPDYPMLLQSFTWQLLDRPPHFPRLLDFLDYWERSLDGTLHSVTVSHAALIGPTRFRYIDREWRAE